MKPVRTLDLVVLAVEWGSGRRQGWLSNLHLGARDPETGGFVMLGKTFKGMTDEMLAWQTERFLELETGREGRVVHVRPELVVEIAFDGVQASSRYPGGARAPLRPGQGLPARQAGRRGRHDRHRPRHPRRRARGHWTRGDRGVGSARPQESYAGGLMLWRGEGGLLDEAMSVAGRGVSGMCAFGVQESRGARRGGVRWCGERQWCFGRCWYGAEVLRARRTSAAEAHRASAQLLDTACNRWRRRGAISARAQRLRGSWASDRVREASELGGPRGLPAPRRAGTWARR